MSNELAVRPKASHQLATLIGMEPAAMLDAIKAQCFKGNAGNVSDAQLAAFVSIAAEMGVNPFLPDMLYAYPDRGAIIPIMGPSGIYKKLMEHPSVDSWETVVYPEDVSLPPTHAITKIWRKGIERPVSYTALVSEWRMGSNPNWNSRPRHMISLRSLKHCARQIIHGLPYDEDDRVIMSEVNVTGTGDANPQAQQQTERPALPPRARKGASAVPDKSAQPHMEAEIVPPKPEAKAEPAQDNAAANEAAKGAASIADKPKTEPAPASTARPDNPKLPRAFLKDKEEINVVCTVESVTPLWAKRQGVRTPSVQSKVIGDFVGLVLHVGGATPGAKPEDDPVPVSEWKIGGKVSLALIGKAQNDGSVRVFVNSIKAEGSPDTAMDVD